MFEKSVSYKALYQQLHFQHKFQRLISFICHFRYYFKSAKTDSCTGDCKRGFLCALKSARPDDPELCEDL